MEQQQSYQERWDYLRQQYRILWIIGLTYVPQMAVIGYPLSRLFHSDIPAFIVWGCWAIGFMVVCNRIQGFYCPRCGNRFFDINLLLSGFVRHCSHCLLPKWSVHNERHTP